VEGKTVCDMYLFTFLVILNSKNVLHINGTHELRSFTGLIICGYPITNTVQIFRCFIVRLHKKKENKIKKYNPELQISTCCAGISQQN